MLTKQNKQTNKQKTTLVPWFIEDQRALYRPPIPRHASIAVLEIASSIMIFRDRLKHVWIYII